MDISQGRRIGLLKVGDTISGTLSYQYPPPYPGVPQGNLTIYNGILQSMTFAADGITVASGPLPGQQNYSAILPGPGGQIQFTYEPIVGGPNELPFTLCRSDLTIGGFGDFSAAFPPNLNPQSLTSPYGLLQWSNNSITCVPGWNAGYALYFSITSVTQQPGFAMTVPLKGNTPGHDLHYTSSTAPVNSVFDHSMSNSKGGYGIYKGGCDGVVTAFTGAAAQYNPSPVSNCKSAYTQNPVAPFLLGPTMTYRGASGINTYLNYDSHPGIDYQAGPGTQVYAAVNGRVHYPNAIVKISNASAYHVMEIIPDYIAPSLPPYVIYYLHSSTYTGQVPTTTTDPTPQPQCQNSAGYGPGGSVTLPLADNDHVLAGCVLALSGNAAPTELKPHLHFEVQEIVPASAVSRALGHKDTQPASTPMLRLDRYPNF